MGALNDPTVLALSMLMVGSILVCLVWWLPLHMERQATPGEPTETGMSQQNIYQDGELLDGFDSSLQVLVKAGVCLNIGAGRHRYAGKPWRDARILHLGDQGHQAQPQIDLLQNKP